MDQTVSLLQKTANTAYKTQQTLKTIASHAETSNTLQINQLETLLDKIKISSISSTYDIIVAGADKMDVLENVNAIHNCMESVEQINTALTRELAYCVPENSLQQLDKNIKSLKAIFEELTSQIS